MTGRAHRDPKERDARSGAVQRVADRPLLRGSLVEMARLCGKPGCRCLQGHKHVSLYLAVRRGKRRTMIYVPAELEETARQWIATGREVDELIDFVSQQCLEQLLERKQTLGRTRASRGALRPRKPPP